MGGAQLRMTLIEGVIELSRSRLLEIAVVFSRRSRDNSECVGDSDGSNCDDNHRNAASLKTWLETVSPEKFPWIGMDPLKYRFGNRSAHRTSNRKQPCRFRSSGTFGTFAIFVLLGRGQMRSISSGRVDEACHLRVKQYQILELVLRLA